MFQPEHSNEFRLPGFASSREDAPCTVEGGASDEEALKVLVVDDEPAVVLHLTDGLRLLGFETRAAQSAAEALELLTEDPAIGVMVTDIRMPGRDGLSLTQEALSIRRSSAPVQVILITGHATVEDATSALRAGARDMLRKPFRLAEAADAVASALEAARTERRALRERAAEAKRIAELEKAQDDLVGRLRDALDHSRLLQAQPDTLLPGDAAAISHALRAPLNAIAGGSAVIAGHGARLLQTGLSYVQEGMQGAIRAVELVEEFIRLENSPDTTLPEQLDLGAIAARALSENEALAAKRSVCLKMRGTTVPVPVFAQRKTIATILSHGLGATIGWAGAGFVVAVTVETLEDGGQLWGVVTLLAARQDAAIQPPPGYRFAAVSSVLTETQEDLHFAIARRLASRIGGVASSWNEGTQAMAIRIALPV